VAEDTGLIVPIGEWALRTACLQAREWQEHGVRGLRVQINISSRQLHGAAFVPTMQRILEDTHCDPGAIGVEITESAVMTDPNEAIEIIRLLHDMGIETAIDDFGTGYSSLAYLKRFALDLLKIDSTFIQGLPNDRDDVAIVQAIIALAHQFRLKVVAEGVESLAQQAFLRAHHCDEVQGYLISKPVPASEVWSLLPSAITKTGPSVV
jgi:EAL domain-containing protein (putative c-di-GMP-specific phosphodiesterase class I)